MTASEFTAWADRENAVVEDWWTREVARVQIEQLAVELFLVAIGIGVAS